MDDEEMMIDPFILVCEEFIAAFERMLPHDINRLHGRYEQAVQLAFDRIEALDMWNKKRYRIDSHFLYQKRMKWHCTLAVYVNYVIYETCFWLVLVSLFLNPFYFQL